jgi:hypothetical protein
MPEEKKAWDLIRGKQISDYDFHLAERSLNYDRETKYEYAKDENGIARKVGSYTVLKDKKTGVILYSKKDE